VSEKAWKTRLQKRGIPEHMHEGVISYLVHHRPVGGFLEAMISGDWPLAARAADKDNAAAFYQWALFFFEEVPAIAHGSAQAYANWSGANEDEEGL
jgi:hypothetical protein